MNKTGSQLKVHTPDPFDGSVRIRLEHMGIIDKDGEVADGAMAVFASIFTGLFFDDLCELFERNEDMLTVYEAFAALHKKDDPHSMYLLLSVQYDYMRKPLPDPVWWLAGDSAAVRAFMKLFINNYEHLMTGSGYLKIEGGK